MKMGLFRKKKIIDLTASRFEIMSKDKSKIDSKIPLGYVSFEDSDAGDKMKEPKEDISPFGFLGRLASSSTGSTSSVSTSSLSSLNSETTQTSEIKRLLRSTTDRLEENANAIYRMQQRLELLEKKFERLERRGV